MPYSQHINDIGMILNAHRSDQESYQQICDHFDVLYQEGATIPRTMAISLHTFLAGIPHHAKHVEKALSYISSHKDVWLCTADDIYSWYESECGD